MSGLFSDCISFLGNTSNVIQLVLLHIALEKINITGYFKVKNTRCVARHVKNFGKKN